MREILFRGKRIDNGEFAYGVPIKSNTGKTYIITYLDDSDGKPTRILWVEVDPTTVGEFTGLSDKNGTKIFEGDKILHSDEYLGAVWYGYDGFCLGNDEAGGMQNPYPWEDCEVIGSIHDKEVE